MGIILPDKITITTINASVPVKITRERRRSMRASVGATGLLFRIPNTFNLKQFDEAWIWFSKWVNQLVVQKPSILNHLIPKRYTNGDFIVIRGLVYKIELLTTTTKLSRATLLPNQVIQLKVSIHDKDEEEILTLRKLISGLMAKANLIPIKSRVAELNRQFFNVKVMDVKIGHTNSRWGSCSNSGIIRLSSRLLLAPTDVIDYVIIHELAHLVEFNHSNQFWNKVESAMPDYKEKETWLKANNYLCNF
jgi:predicted metal-dependent hydrolase